MLDETFDSEHFYIGEGMIPSGNWSGYPPHRHDFDDLPGEIDMEETYFYRFDPPQGFGIQKVYQPDGSIDETYTVKNNDTVAIAEGYHPLCGAPGYQMYYLWTNHLDRSELRRKHETVVVSMSHDQGSHKTGRNAP